MEIVAIANAPGTVHAAISVRTKVMCAIPITVTTALGALRIVLKMGPAKLAKFVIRLVRMMRDATKQNAMTMIVIAV